MRLNDDGTTSGQLKTWSTEFIYDLNDRLTHIMDAQGNLKIMEHDGLKRKVFMNDPDKGVMTYIYDAASKSY